MQGFDKHQDLFSIQFDKTDNTESQMHCKGLRALSRVFGPL